MAKDKRKGAGAKSRRPRATRPAAPKTHPSRRRSKPAPANSAPARHAPAAHRHAGAPAPAATYPLYQVDAFTRRRFHGNPAAVVILAGAWPADEVLLAIAAENNLSETAFVIPKGGRTGSPRFALRWFTPQVEVSLCGHATLAAAHVLWSHRSVKGSRLVFESQSGPLPVDRLGQMIVLDFPAIPGEQIALTGQLSAALGRAPTEVYKTPTKLMAVFDNRRDVYALDPDHRALAALDALGVIVTAPGAGHDFVSRFFAPRLGIAEDPVTGSAHCTLVPYWAARLGKKTLFAHQVSRRGGELMCQHVGDRVRIGGHAVTVVVGAIRV